MPFSNGLPTYGYWGGPGHSGNPGDPGQDGLDDLFKEHDLAYEAANNLSGTEAAMAILAADLRLLAGMNSLDPNDPNSYQDPVFGKAYQQAAFEAFTAKVLLWDIQGVLVNGVVVAVANAFTASQTFIAPRRDPLTLDLDNDGLETVGTAAGILFDHTGSGIKAGTGWVKPDDGFLVLDRGVLNGVIDNGTELFGDSTLKSNGQLATDGFDAVRDLDSNLDGKISSADAQFANLRVWRDLNQDGISQSGELFTLGSLNIASINVTSTTHSQVLANGNQIADLGQYTKTDGSTGVTGEVSGSLGDINLATDTFHRQFTDPLDTTAAVTLPDMQGSGAVRDLREAASQSPGLAAACANDAVFELRRVG